jgi:hypothetical protein
MHHFRGKLFQGDKLCLDPANVYIDYNSTEVDVTSNWSGYLLVASEKDVVPGGIYTLKLEDGAGGPTADRHPHPRRLGQVSSDVRRRGGTGVSGRGSVIRHQTGSQARGSPILLECPFGLFRPIDARDQADQ